MLSRLGMSVNRDQISCVYVPALKTAEAMPSLLTFWSAMIKSVSGPGSGSGPRNASD